MKRLLLLALLWLTALPALADAFNARINQERLQAGETLTLTLETPASASFVDPDIAPLYRHFELLSSQHQSAAQSSDGMRRWIFELRPLRTGTLQIPSLRLGDLRSNALTVEVLPASEPGQSTDDGLFMEISIDQEQPYVQAQVIFSIRAHYDLTLYSGGQLVLPDNEQTRIVPLGEAVHSRQQRGNTEYGILSKQYAVFPQISGQLELPAPRFIATPVQPADIAPSLEGAPPSLHVQPIPDSFPADALWLPASTLELTQRWHGQPDNLPFEQPLTGQLRLQAQGLPVSYLALPELARPIGFARFDNPPDSQQLADANGLRSQLELQLLLVPKQSGEQQLSGLEIPWWNTRNDQLEYVRTSASVFNVLPPVSLSEQPAAAPATLWPWQLSSAGLALLSLILTVLWLRARRLPAILPNSRQATSQRLLDQLRKACQANQPQQARQLLDQWMRSRETSAEAMLALCPPLQSAISTLNQCLYAPGDHHWDGQPLRDALDALLQAERLQGAGQLPPLYPV